MPRKQPPRTPLHCRRCVKGLGKLRTEASKGLRIERGAQYRRVNGARRRAVNVTCPEGHEFWSVHREALERADRRDERATEKAAVATGG